MDVLIRKDIELPATVEGCHDLFSGLQDTISQLFKRVERLEEDNKKLLLENVQLKEKLNNSSSNSSLPPSKDFKKKKNKKPSSKNKSGGQKGHKGHFRELLNSADVNSIINCPLPKWCICGGNIRSKEDFQRHQVHELPDIKLDVTEYRLEKGCCQSCGQNQVASLPAGIKWGITGPKLTAFMSHMISKYQLSRRELKEFLKEHYYFNIGLGTVFNKQKIVNAALERPTAELLTLIKEKSIVH